MALPILQNNPIIGETAMRGGAMIANSLANLGASIKDNLEKEALLNEAREAAPYLTSTYKNAFSAFQAGDIGTGYSQLIDAATRYPGNPLINNINKMAIQAGQGMADAVMQREMMGIRYGNRPESLSPSQVDAQFDGTPPSTGEVDVTGELPQEEPDMTMDPTGGVIPGGGMPVGQTQSSPQPTPQQKIASMAPDQRAQASAPALDTNGVSENDFEVYQVPEKLRPFFLGASGIGLPKKSDTSVSESKTVNSRGTYSRSQTKSTSDPKVSKETKENFDAVMKSAGTLNASQGIQKAIKSAGGFQNLQRAEQSGGGYGKEQNAITWPGNEGKPIQVSDEEMKAFDAIQSLPAMASGNGAKFFGISSEKQPPGVRMEAKSVGVPRSIVEALKSNPRDANAIAELKRRFGTDAERIQQQIISR